MTNTVIEKDTFNLKTRVPIINPFPNYLKAVNHDLSMRKTALVPYQKAGKRIVEKAKPGDKIIEVGMNSGMVSFYIAGQVPDAEIYGIEENDKLFEVATDSLNLLFWSNMQYNIEFEQSDLTSLPFDNKVADIVFSHNSMHLWKNPAAVLKECARICKDDGIIIIEDFNRWAEEGFISFVLQFVKEGANFFLESLRSGYNEDEIKAILREAGLEDWKIYLQDLNAIISSKSL